MKIALLLLTLSVVMWLGDSTPIDPKNQLVNRPKIDQFGARERRSPPAGTKGRHVVRARGSMRRDFDSLQNKVTKGTYICGNKICKLPIGVEPEGCNGMCQYPVGF